MRKGERTDHDGFGKCYLHGGRTPSGKAAAAKEKAAGDVRRAEGAMAKLGIPVGTGDPMQLLAKAVRHAEGHLEATAAVLQETAAGQQPGGLDVQAIVDIHADAIRSAARVGKAAVDADVADRLAALDERGAELIMRFVGELLERVVPVRRRPAELEWARARFAQLATEYEQPGAVH